jgi:site-specific recombinase XerD
MLKYKDGEKYRSKRLAGPNATLTDIYQAVDAQKNSTITTFCTLSNDFQKSPLWRRLSILTQRDYLDCHAKICNTPGTKYPLGDAPISAWTVGTVRQYRDKRSESSMSRANKELAYIKRIFSWAYEYEKIKTNIAQGVKKLTIKPRQHYAEDKDYDYLLQHAKNSGYWYAPYCMELAYRCRMRLSEVLDLTDANALDDGLLIKRRKGSRDNIVKWTPQLQKLWTDATAQRNKILDDRNQPHPIKASDRYLFISARTGDRIQTNSLKTAMDRIGDQAELEAKRTGTDFVRFTFHDLKRKGVSDATGDKLEASGHRTASMLNIYDVKLKTVEPSGE